MLTKNIDISPLKKVRVITINEGGLNHPKKRRQVLPPVEKDKRPTSKIFTTGSQAALSDPKDDQLVQSLWDEIRS